MSVRRMMATTRRELRVLHVVPCLSAEWGGPHAVINDWLAHLPKHQISSRVISTTGRDHSAALPVTIGDVTTIGSSRLAAIWTGHSFNFFTVFEHMCATVDIVHLHELWHYPAYIAAKTAARMNIPYIITPHGEMEAYSFGSKRLRKAMYWHLVQRDVIQAAALVHCITTAELRRLADLVPSASGVVIPNGIELAARCMVDRVTDEDAQAPISETHSIHYLGRLHHKKGIDLLIAAFGVLCEKVPNMVLRIAGPDEGGYSRELRIAVASLAPSCRVEFVGALTGEAKLKFLRSASVVCIPSRSDVRTIVAVEAMMCEVPLVISTECQFPEVEEKLLGWTCTPDPVSIANVVSRVLQQPSEAKRRAQCAREFVERELGIDSVASRIAAMYQAVAGHEVRSPVFR